MPLSPSLIFDTLWRHKVTNVDFHWKGRVCKIYTKLLAGG